MLIHNVVGIFLAPVLGLQGFYVRKKTPQLPEPDGVRSGKKGRGQELKLLILGDSAAAGVGAERQEKAFSGQLTNALSEHYKVRWKLVAKTGMRSRGLLSEVIEITFERFDFVVVSIGVNDVTHGTGAEIWRKNLQSLLDLVRKKFQPRRIFLSSIPPIHLFPALPQPLRWWIGRRALFLNTIMEEIAKKDERTEVVNTEFPFSDKYMAHDGFHPSEAAYRLWGKAMAESISDARKKGL